MTWFFLVGRQVIFFIINFYFQDAVAEPATFKREMCFSSYLF